MSSTSLFSRYKAFWILIGFFLVLEIVLRAAPIEYGAGAGVFLTEHRRELAEASSPEFDYIMLGDSRSLSVNGHKKSSAEPYSLYNFSMPAMGPRYFKHLLLKYIENRKTPPAAVILSMDPGNFQKSWHVPLYDSNMRYADRLDESTLEYLSKRTIRGLQRPFTRDGIQMWAAYSPDEIWDHFGHRFLNLFSFAELAGQFRGPERLFVLKEALPMTSHVYRYREALASLTFSFRRSAFKDQPLPDYCNTCGGVQREECHPDVSNFIANRRLEAHLEKTNGGINLGDRLSLTQRMQYLMIRDSEITRQVAYFQDAEMVMDPLLDLIQTATDRGIKVVLSTSPTIDAYKTSPYYVRFEEQLRAKIAQNPLVKVLNFKNQHLPRSLFIEQVHYECEGAAQVNHDFYQNVMPEIIRFAPPGAR